MASESVDQGQGALVLHAEDGAVYAIPQAAIESFRLSDEQKATLEPEAADEDDVKGHQYIGVFNPGPYRWTHWQWTNQWFPDTSYYPSVN